MMMIVMIIVGVMVNMSGRVIVIVYIRVIHLICLNMMSLPNYLLTPITVTYI